MKKILCICLTVIVLCSLFTGCVNNGANNNAAKENIASEREILSDAEQRVVNQLCLRFGVQSVKVNFGTENAEIYKDVWIVHLKGKSYPTDPYGDTDYMNEYKFSYRVSYELNGKFKNISTD